MTAARQSFSRTDFCIVKTVSMMSVKPERNQHHNPVAARLPNLLESRSHVLRSAWNGGNQGAHRID
jgi:hypothetical protein